MGGLNSAETKNLIYKKIYQLYISYNNMIESKEDLINIIEQSLNDEEAKYIRENEIREYFLKEIDIILKREQKEKCRILSIQENFIKKIESILLNINENPGKNGVEMSQVLFEDINSKINIIKDKIEKNKSIDKNGEQIVEMKYKDLENNLFNEIEKLKAKILNSVDRERKDEYESQLKLEEKKKEVSK